MNILITSGMSETARLLAEGLRFAHTLRLTDEPEKSNGEVVACELGDDESTDQLCDGIETIVLVCEPGDLSDSEVIDAHSRKVYNLLTAASESEVGHVIFVSSLKLFDDTPSQYEIDEQWAPSVTTDPDVLRYHVAEFVCREFARNHSFPVTCLRFGDVVDGEVGEDQVSAEAMVGAVSAALDRRPAGWSVFHIVSEGTRFVTRRVEERLEFQPRGDG